MKTNVTMRTLPLLAVGAMCTTGLLSVAAAEDVGFEIIRLERTGAVPQGGVAGDTCEYSYDDGIADNGFGQANTGMPTVQIGMSNAFTLNGECTTINSVNVSWGPHTEPQPAIVAVYADPNNDGDPSDVGAADLLSSATGMTSMADTDIFVPYAIPEVELVPGNVYHVIAICDDIGGGEFPLAFDTTNVSGNSWLLLGIGDTADPYQNNGLLAELGSATIGAPGSFMVRLGGAAAPNLCPTDIDGNGATDVDDLVAVILEWNCMGSCVADVNGDNMVNVDDLVAVILAWGPCPVGNDTCDTAQFSFAGDGTFFLGEISCDPVSVGFNNIGAGNDGGAFACGNGTADVWFEVPFNCTGKAVINTNGSDFDTLIEAYAVTAGAAGGDCGSLTLLGCDNDSGDDGVDSALVLDVAAGTTLYIRVGGGDLGAEGSGTLNLCCAEFLPDPPPNDDCADAIALAPGGTDSQSTISAEADPQAFPCGVTVDAPGAWYTVTGTGNTMTASLCDGTDYDAKLFVYCGPCGELACIGGDDDGCDVVGGPSEVSWCSEAAREYLVYVSGFGGSTGNYTITLTDGGVGCGAPDECTPNEVLANDECVDAIPISNGLTPYSTLQATSSDSPAHAACVTGGDGGITVNDIWFTYTVDCPADFGLLTVSTCEDVGAEATYDTDIVVYDASSGVEAACGDLSAALIGCNDDNCPIGAPADPWHSHAEVPVTNGQELIIRVGGFGVDGADLGEGVLLIDCVPADDDRCEFATAVDISGGSADAQIDNCGATVDDLAPICGASAPDAPGRWLSFVGDGNTITVATCNTNNPGAGSNNFIDTRLTVYCGAASGDVCSDLECATEEPIDNGACPFTEELSFCTELGRTYLVLVQGTTTGAGGCEGVIDVSFAVGGACADPPCPPPPPGDEFDDPIVLGLTLGATTEDSRFKSDYTDNAGDPNPELCAGSGGPFTKDASWWYRITIPAGTSSTTISMCATDPGDGQVWDSVLAVFPVGVAPIDGNEVACDDDTCTAPAFGPFELTAGSATLVPGTQYLVHVGIYTQGAGAPEGPWVIEITPNP